ncbi:MAG: AAA family ATPase [Clostridia bacterium]|nr:AAA family ATPase [Clostridia bacterium]
MMFKRKIYDRLLRWKEESGRTAILIEGARRVGKSTVAEEFAKNEYKSYILIDFSTAGKTVKGYFEDHMNDPDTLFMLLCGEYKTDLYRRESVIIFDEVQEFPRARECIKQLVKDGRYDYIETGSLISIRENTRGIVIPSEEDSVTMYPLDFEEFCRALGNPQIIEYIRLCFGEKKNLDNGLHKSAMLLFRQYMLVGGMPQAVSRFVETGKSLTAADAVKRRILNLYREDIRKISSPYKSKVTAIYDQMPGLLSRHEKRVIFSDVEGSSIDRYEDTFFWLDDSMICNVCFNCCDPEAGLARNEDRTYVKCYMGDTGLLLSHAFAEKEIEKNSIYSLILNGKLSLNEGMLYENAVAQMLVSSGFPLYFYTHYSEEKHRNDIEIDFLIPESGTLNRMISPIEVKSTTRYSTVSLERFREKFPKRIVRSIVIHPGEFRETEGVLYIPPYMAFCL